MRTGALIVLAACAACGGSPKPAGESAPIENKSRTPAPPVVPPSHVEQGARVIARTAKGGEIELSSLDGAPFEEAKEHMARHCGNEHSLIQTTERRDSGRTTLVDGKPEPVYVVRMTYACAP